MSHVLLICHVSSKIGMGHLSRLLALAETLRKNNKVIPEFLIFGDFIRKDELAKFKVQISTSNFQSTVKIVLVPCHPI